MPLLPRVWHLLAPLFLYAGLAVASEAFPPALKILFNPGFAKPGGGRLEAEAFRGRPMLINFWATWCPPCRRELPLLAEAHGRYGARVAFLGLAVEDNNELVGEFARAYALPYPVAAGKDAAIALMQELGNGNAVMPFTVILDAEGRQLFARAGVVSEQELTRVLAPYRDQR